MGVWRTQHTSVCLAVQVVVALEMAVAAQEALVLETPHRLPNSEFARASCSTIRLKMLKIGALVRTSVRRIKLAMPSAFPYQAEYCAAHAALAAAQ